MLRGGLLHPKWTPPFAQLRTRDDPGKKSTEPPSHGRFAAPRKSPASLRGLSGKPAGRRSDQDFGGLCWSNQALTCWYQKTEFCGLSTQWFSFG